jgi:hypothetical protein
LRSAVDRRAADLSPIERGSGHRRLGNETSSGIPYRVVINEAVELAKLTAAPMVTSSSTVSSTSLCEFAP